MQGPVLQLLSNFKKKPQNVETMVTLGQVWKIVAVLNM